MKDRQPTQPGRVKLTPENGTSPFYAVMEMADEPTEVGTPPTKANLLQDETEFALFGNLADRTVNDAFVGVAAELRTIRMRLDNVSTLSVTLRSTQGNALPDVYIQGMFDANGNTCITNSAGVASGYVSEGSVTLGVIGYADIVDYTETFTATAGEEYTKVLTVTTRNFMKVTSSKNVKFSGNVTRIDASVVGGGAGGAAACNNNSRLASGAGGAGGIVVTRTDIAIEANKQYQVVVGAGGTGGTPNANGGTGGGTSSAFGITATGATACKLANLTLSTATVSTTGTGNGLGGKGVTSTNAAVNGNAGGNGTVAAFTSFTETATLGAGGGSGSVYAGTAGNGGTTGGGNGGKNSSHSSSSGQNGGAATANTGSGGGGGGATAYFDGDDDAWKYFVGYGGKGADGVVAIRVHLSVA